MAFKTSQDGLGGHIEKYSMGIDAENAFSSGVADTTTATFETKVEFSANAGRGVALAPNRIVTGVPDTNGGQGSFYIHDWAGNVIVNLPSMTNYVSSLSNDQFGYEVAAGHGLIAIAGPQPIAYTTRVGRVVILDYDGVFQYELNPSDGVNDDRFGWRMKIRHNKIYVSAPQGYSVAGGKLYIYDLDGSNEVIVDGQDIETGVEGFAAGMTVGDNHILATGRKTDGFNAVYVLDIHGNYIRTITASTSNTNFGGYGANTLDRSLAEGAGLFAITGVDEIFLYDYSGNLVNTIVGTQPSNYFGYSVVIDKNRIIAGEIYNDQIASNQGKVWIYDFDGNIVGSILPSDNITSALGFGHNIDVLGNKILVGMPNLSRLTGSYLYDYPSPTKSALDVAAFYNRYGN